MLPKGKRGEAIFKILLFENSYGIDLISEVLSPKGFEVSHVPNREAVYEMTRMPLDLEVKAIVVDFLFDADPVCDLIAQLRKNWLGSAMPIICVCGLLDQEQREEGGQCGITHWVNRPLGEEFNQKVADIIGAPQKLTPPESLISQGHSVAEIPTEKAQKDVVNSTNSGSQSVTTKKKLVYTGWGTYKFKD